MRTGRKDEETESDAVALLSLSSSSQIAGNSEYSDDPPQKIEG
jgi:hypothetical protein